MPKLLLPKRNDAPLQPIKLNLFYKIIMLIFILFRYFDITFCGEIAMNPTGCKLIYIVKDVAINERKKKCLLRKEFCVFECVIGCMPSLYLLFCIRVKMLKIRSRKIGMHSRAMPIV